MHVHVHVRISAGLIHTCTCTAIAQLRSVIFAYCICNYSHMIEVCDYKKCIITLLSIGVNVLLLI